jgi:hypothetical protein
VYHCDISLLSRPRIEHGKNGQFRVQRLENEADYSLPFTANIGKAWSPTSIHTSSLYNVHGSTGTFCKVTELPLHNGVAREHSQVRRSKLFYSQDNVDNLIHFWREN